MKKNKNIDKSKKIKNPLDGIPIKSLLITLIALLLTFGLGFGSGFGCRSVTASALVNEQPLSGELTVRNDPVLYSNSFSAIGFNSSFVKDTANIGLYMPVGAAGLRSVQIAWVNATSGSSSRYLVTQFFIDARRDFESYYAGTLDNPHLGFKTSLVSVGSGPPSVSASFSFDIPLFYYGAGSLSSDSFGTFPLSIETSAQSQSGQYTVSYLSTSTVPLDRLANDEISTTLLEPLYAFYQPFPIGQIPLNFDMRLVCACRLYTTTNTDLSSNPFVDILVTCDYKNLFGYPSVADTQIVLPTGLKYFNYTSSEVQSAYDEGYELGNRVGYTAGQNKGYELGFSAGKEVGLSESIEDVTPWQHIVNAVNSFMHIEIIPNVSISLILSIAFGLILLGFLIKFMIGG